MKIKNLKSFTFNLQFMLENHKSVYDIQARGISAFRQFMHMQLTSLCHRSVWGRWNLLSPLVTFLYFFIASSAFFFFFALLYNICAKGEKLPNMTKVVRSQRFVETQLELFNVIQKGYSPNGWKGASHNIANPSNHFLTLSFMEACPDLISSSPPIHQVEAVSCLHSLRSFFSVQNSFLGSSHCCQRPESLDKLRTGRDLKYVKNSIFRLNHAYAAVGQAQLDCISTSPYNYISQDYVGINQNILLKR